MKLSDPAILAALPELGVERIGGASLAERTSLQIGGTTDLLLIRRHSCLPELIGLLRGAGVPYKFLGGGTNLLVRDGELPWVVLQLAHRQDEVRLEGIPRAWTLPPTSAAPSQPAPSTIWAAWRA